MGREYGMTFIPRSTQAEILKYTGGTMGISAVPGSGKTHTLSALAAKLVEQMMMNKTSNPFNGTEREVLIVTFSNSAVSNFSARIAKFLSEKGLVPGIGYRVRTLHGMATDIVRGRAEGYGLDPDFNILDETAANMLLRRAVEQWATDDNTATFNRYIKKDIKEEKQKGIFSGKWLDDITTVAGSVISQAKDYQLSPEMIAGRLKSFPGEDFSLLRMVSSIYSRYQTMLRSYPALDFADLMFYAAQILENDPVYLNILQDRWPFILEDEAQDSSLIQEKVLRLLTKRNGNWVRVGDPNQAINETFTTADPKFLKEFLKEADRTVDLAHSGRSTISILKLANQLIRWVQEEHPTKYCRDALVKPYIKTTPKNDPQQNPKDEPKRVVIDGEKHSPIEEVRMVSEAAAIHTRNYPQETVAILVPNNNFGTKFVDELKKYPVEVIEILKSTRSTRYTADQIAKVLFWLSIPTNNERCRKLFSSLYHHAAEGDFYLSLDHSQIATAKIKSIENLENFFYPNSNRQFEELILSWELPEIVIHSLFSFRHLLKKWLEARTLRIDQLILLIAQDLYSDSDSLGIASQLSRIALQMTQADPSMQLNAVAENINKAAANADLYPELSKPDIQFDPNLYQGKIVVTTFHKAKGLEWDQVYLTSCNNYEFPAGSGYTPRGYREYIRSQFFYIRDQLDIQAEALEQLRILFNAEPSEIYREGKGSVQSYNSVVSERLRLLYVGITRAKKGLHISWNSGHSEQGQEALAIKFLRECSEGKKK